MWNPQNLYSDYVLREPTVLFGQKAFYGLYNYPGARFVIIHGQALLDDDKAQILSALKKKAVYFVKKSWDDEPDLEGLKGTISEIERIMPDVIIAIGGGSVIDGAKLCRLFYEFPYYKSGETRLNELTFKSSLIAVPTTVGSGAEASSAAVYVNHEKKRKEMVVNTGLMPNVVILKSDFVERVTQDMLIASLLDAVGHIVEGYVSNVNNSLTDIKAESGLKIIYDEMADDKEEISYFRLQYAGYLGGIVQNHCVVGVAHGIAHQMNIFGYSHGEAVALLLSAVIRMNSLNQDIKERYQLLCVKAGLGTLDNLLRLIEKLLKKATFKDKGSRLKEILLEQLQNDEFVKNIKDDLGGRGNPIEITSEYLDKLVKEYL